MNKGCLIGLGIFIVLSAVGLGYYFYQQGNKAPEQTEVESPVMTDIVKKTVATGSILPRHEVLIKPQVSGVIEQLYVEAGMQVKKGQKLARIKLVPSEVNINSAQSNVKLARLRLREAKRELERQREVNDRNLAVEAAAAAYENAREIENRQRQLLEDGVISQQDYDRAKMDLKMRKTEYENAKINATNNLRQFKNQVNIREQELEAAVNNLQLLREGMSSKSRQVANIVMSTVNGMVLDIPIEEGASVIERNNFNEGTTIAAIANMDALIFEGKVDESDVGKLREGMPLELTVGAIENQTFGAALEYISPKGEEEEGTVKFEIRAAVKPVDDVFLRAGYSANADIILDRRQQVLAIKERDVHFEGDTTYVEVMTGDRQFEKRPVQLGISDGIMVEVVNGLDTSDRIKVLKQS